MHTGDNAPRKALTPPPITSALGEIPETMRKGTLGLQPNVVFLALEVSVGLHSYNITIRPLVHSCLLRENSVSTFKKRWGVYGALQRLYFSIVLQHLEKGVDFQPGRCFSLYDWARLALFVTALWSSAPVFLATMQKRLEKVYTEKEQPSERSSSYNVPILSKLESQPSKSPFSTLKVPTETSQTSTKGPYSIDIWAMSAMEILISLSNCIERQEGQFSG
jgi:hypothetical protein